MNLMELVHVVPGIDFAVGGHTHRGYQEPWIDPVNHTMCFETFGNGSSIGHVVLLIDRKATAALVGWEPSPRPGHPGHPLRGRDLARPGDRPRSSEPYQERAEAEMKQGHRPDRPVRWAGARPGPTWWATWSPTPCASYFDADFRFQNMGGLRADLPAGDITARDIFSVLPFGNELMEVEDGRPHAPPHHRAQGGRPQRRYLRLGRQGGLRPEPARLRPGRAPWRSAGKPWDPDRIYKAVVHQLPHGGQQRPGVPDRPSPPKDITAHAGHHGRGGGALPQPAQPGPAARWTTAGSRPRVRPRPTT